MKKIILLVSLVISISAAYSQQTNSADLIGTWDQSEGQHPATIQFLDSGTVRYSYKGHTGSSRKYYYLVNTQQTPALLTVDMSKKHKKHRNQYLFEFIDHDTIKLQVLFKRDSREHFTEEPKYKTVTLIRRK